jgi:hypothetical protein
MRASRAQFLQTRFDVHVDLGCVFFAKSQAQPIPYAWMARMQFDKAVRHSPQRADEIARFYAQHGCCKLSVDFFQRRLEDASCSHDPAAWHELGDALQTMARSQNAQVSKQAVTRAKAQAAFDKEAQLRQPALPPQSQVATSAPPPMPNALTAPLAF